MSRGRDWKAAAAGAAGRWTIGLLMKTVRFEVEYEDERFASRDWDDPVIFSLWHGRLLPLTYFHRGKPVTAIISLSRDGEYIARLVEGWGYETARGSTSRGGRAALKGLVEAARAGRTLAITPDGPRGPRQQLQPGVIAAAQKTGLPIVPLGCGASVGSGHERDDRGAGSGWRTDPLSERTKSMPAPAENVWARRGWSDTVRPTRSSGSGPVRMAWSSGFWGRY